MIDVMLGCIVLWLEFVLWIFVGFGCRSIFDWKSE